jgi:hypothetical protein
MCKPLVDGLVVVHMYPTAVTVVATGWLSGWVAPSSPPPPPPRPRAVCNSQFPCRRPNLCVTRLSKTTYKLGRRRSVTVLLPDIL